MVKILRKFQENQEAQFPKFSIGIGHESIFRRSCFQTAKEGIQIQVYNINNASENHFRQFIAVKVKKI